MTVTHAKNANNSFVFVISNVFFYIKSHASRTKHTVHTVKLYITFELLILSSHATALKGT